MTRKKLFIVIVIIASLVFISSCGKSKIADTMRGYVEARISEGETFHFVGLSNHRDTVFMGTTRHCVGVIYTVTDNQSGEKTRHYADVIFDDDYNTALSVEELDFDPIEYAREKVKDAFKEKIREKLNRE